MHRARHSAAATLRRPRVLILLSVALVGLFVALWLPTRNDSASAHENGRRGGDRQGQRRDGRDGNRDGRDGRQGIPPILTPPAGASPTESAPTAEPTSPEPPVTTEPTAEPPTTEPPTTEPPAPTTAPTSEAPKAEQWAPFTDYTAGQIVSFQGKDYQVQQTHTSLPGWEPTKLPDLFKQI